MKKLVSIFLTIAMIFAISVPTLAADTTNLTIDGLAGRTYQGYKLLHVTSSLKTGEHPDGCNGDGGHIKECYTYAYTIINDDYRTILREEVFENSDPQIEGATAATDITDAQIIEYLSKQTSGDYASLRVVADRIYRAIKAQGLTAELPEFTGNTARIDQGYWLFADTTNLTGENANSFVMVDTKGELDLTISPKTDLPTLTKKVKDVNDSNTADALTNGWGDFADHDVDDDVEFKLIATLPENLAYYQTYKLEFRDKLAAGLELNDDLVVTLYANENDANNGVNGTPVTGSFAVATVEGYTFVRGCDDILNIDGTTVTKDSVFVVTYSAELTADAVVGAAGNTNEATLVFSNDPYGTSTGSTSDAVKVYTYEFVVNKIDEFGDSLQGATFTLSKKKDGGYVVIDTVTTNTPATTFTWKGLDDGEYKLEETVVPAGYNKMADVEFTITAEHADEATFALNSTYGEVGTNKGTITADVVNRAGTVLPETGAMGTLWLIFGGATLVVLAGIFMITRKKMSIYED